MKLVDISKMRAVEKEADAQGLSYAQMMENAGLGLAEEIASLVYEEGDEPLVALGLVGPGNNGGDTLVALAHLSAQDWHVRAYLVNRPAESDPLIDRLIKAGGEVTNVSADANLEMLGAFIGSATIILDGLLGTGFKMPLKEEFSKVLDKVNSTLFDLDWPPLVVAVDCPSGVNCDTGEVAEETIPAGLTITMAAVKEGLLKFPAYNLVGDIKAVDIGLTNQVESWRNIRDKVADEEMVSGMLPVRPDDSHKGTFGTAMVVAGSINYTGAALLSGRSAYRIGAGLVTMAVPSLLHTALAGHFPEGTWLLLPHETGVISAEAADVLLKNLEKATALLIGPGLGQEETTRSFLDHILKGKANSRKGGSRIGFVSSGVDSPLGKTSPLPKMVVDADGLRLLKKIDGWEKLIPANSILTPHPGEMADLTGLPVSDIQNDRLGTARKYAQAWGHVVVLKGALTVIADADGAVTVIPVATSALAHAGTGDVLAGLVVGLLAQGLEPSSAAVSGAWIHARAGQFAADRIGSPTSVLAGDVVDSISDVLISVE